MNEQERRLTPRPNQFVLVCVVVELALVPLAWLVELIWPPQKFSLEVSLDALLFGGVGAVPPIALLLWLLSPGRREQRFVRKIRQALREAAGPTLAGLRLWHMVPISIAAGVGEEILFRGALQPRLGLVFTSVLFGILHPFTLAYAAFAGLLGAYLGWLQLKTGNLVVPVVVHALYDLAALLVVGHDLRNPRPDDEPMETEKNGV